jgi:hypothetical protein
MVMPRGKAELLYDPDTGYLMRKSGRRAGSPCGNYRKIKGTYEHRYIWEIHNGPIPKGMEIDHINRDKEDNRIENLRCVTRKENQNNVIGKKGYTYESDYKSPFHVRIGKEHIGRYDTILDARAAYLRAKKERDVV